MSDYGDDAYVYESGDEGEYERQDFQEDMMCIETTDKLSSKIEPYKILNFTDIEGTMKEIVQNVAETLGVEPEKAQLLLTNNRWDDEKLCKKYCDNSTMCCTEAGIDMLDVNAMHTKLEGRTSVPTFLCKVCHDDAATDGFSLGCGHAFCIGCYKGYLHNQVSEGPLCVIARCPEHKCNQVIPPSVFEACLNTADTITFKGYVLRQFIESNKSYRYCPAPNCDLVSQGCGATHIGCACGHQYCFHCAEEDHRPCDCTTLSKWIDKCNIDSATAKWFAEHTKLCPNCFSRVDHNLPFHHMACRHCRHEFCWICRGDWIGHSSCNRFTEEYSLAMKKNNFERYMHFYKRYQDHDQQRAKTMDLQLSTMQEQDCLVIKEAAEQVIACRRVLKYTYVVGYYMDEDAPTKQLFECHQERLEENTQHLQELIEPENLKTLDRSTVTEYISITEKFRDSLLQHTTPDTTHD